MKKRRMRGMSLLLAVALLSTALATSVTAANAGPASAEASEADMVDPDGDASGWEDGGRTVAEIQFDTMKFWEFIDIEEESMEEHERHRGFWSTLGTIVSDFVIGKFGWLGDIIGAWGTIDADATHNRMSTSLREERRAREQLEEKVRQQQDRIQHLENQLYNNHRIGADERRRADLNSRLVEARTQNRKLIRALDNVYKKNWELEQARLRLGRAMAHEVPNVCINGSSFNRRRCGQSFHTLWIRAKNITEIPRYCAKRGDVYRCASGGEAQKPPNKARPKFGEFICEDNGRTYWSNGYNAYSQIGKRKLQRCRSVSFSFTGRYKPATGARLTYRALGSRDCPNQDEIRNVPNCPDDGRPIDTQHPDYPFGCVENEQGRWKCPGDSGYIRDEPVNGNPGNPATNGDNPRPAEGHFTCVGNSKRYYSDGKTAYRLLVNNGWTKCPGVTYDLHVYVNGTHAHTVKP